MSEPTDLDIGPESREVDVELGPRPRTLSLELELTTDELKHIRRGIGKEAMIIQFLKSAALKEADRLAIANEHDSRYQFKYWALGLVDARPAAGGKKGADSGIDGYINFFDDNSGKAKRIIVQVKSGHVNRAQIATLKGDMERENAALSIFITLEPPTNPMTQEAIAAGFYEPESLPGNQYPKVQILTIEQLLSGDQPKYPRFASQGTFRKAPRQKRQQGIQQTLDT